MANIIIGDKEYVLFQDADGYWYYRDSYTQNFGKKVKFSGDYLMVWNPGKSIISTEEIVGGTGSSFNG